ncbi:MAG TPA: GH116 family glycosyl hydrolase [Candidatus Cybelea sp.]
MARLGLAPVSTDPTHHAVVDPRFAYILPDDQMAQGSTIGAPRCCMVIKPTGTIQKVFSPDCGLDLFGAVQVHYWDRRSGIRLTPLPGEFHIHPERQDHTYTLDNGVHVHEQLFAYNDRWQGDDVPPPAVYYRVRLHNSSGEAVRFDAYAFAQLRGNTSHDVVAVYDGALGGIVAWNRGAPSQLRLFAANNEIAGWEVNDDPGKALARLSPRALANAAQAEDDPIGVLAVAVDLAPGDSRWLEFVCVLSTSSREDLTQARHRCPAGAQASRQTSEYYWSYLKRSVLRTPNQYVNHGVLWAKANMLRVQTYAPTGWCFTNDPTRSNNSVARDTAWMCFGADYVNHHFARESLDAFFRLQQPSGKIVEYYDVRNGESADYGLNVNDDTPLVVLALWHHYALTQNEEYLRKRYPNAVAAMEYMLSQRNADGLIWCTSTQEMEAGIVGWRNVIPNYRISGASTEVNSECYAALISLAEMARACGDRAACAKYLAEAHTLQEAINAHLVNPENDLYLLAIDVDGTKRTEVTADLVFPVLFGVAPPSRAARIIGALSDDAFWTDAGIRTVPREALSYGPVHGFGLLGGVWVAVTYWFAFAAAKYEPGSMAEALASAFRHFSIDPRRNNTVPGQFAEWLHGEILSNEGMMLSPWDAPRYLWAAIEGAGGLHVVGTAARIEPSLANEWRWLAAVNVPFRDRFIAWIACRMADGLRLFTTSDLASKYDVTRYQEEITDSARVADPVATLVAFSGEQGALVFVGNATTRTTITAASLDGLAGSDYEVRLFTTVSNEWEGLGRLSKQAISDGIAVIVSAGGFVLLEISS